ncbi:MAG: hypothetical protein K0V04_34695 [Deltaproteobacteria bacterium]|nr:hypothetical protein [Deltaproteobacteria bacterium]
MSGGQWHESLFDADKGDSLGDGSWGSGSDEPSGLAKIAWDQLPEPAKKKKERARLATPAPGSERESGLLDIKTLAPQLHEKLASEQPIAVRARQATPSPASARPAARLATAAKGSNGSGLIDVQELMRLQQAQTEAAQGDPLDGAQLPAASSSLLSNTSLSSSELSGSVVAEIAAIDAKALPPKGRGMLWASLAVLLIAFAGLAVYVVVNG